MENNQEDILKLLGIKIDDGKFELDINKTKSFFENLQTTVEQKVEDINRSIQEGKLDLKNSVGLKVQDQKIELDLNKTKNFLEELSNKAQNFVNMIDKSVSNFSSKKENGSEN